MAKYSRRRRTRELPSSPAWMVTYGDMMTLLLTFFVLLFTFSSLNMAKFQAVLLSLKDALGLLEGGTSLRLELEPTTLPGELETEWEREQLQLESLKAELESFIQAEELEEQISLVLEERGLVIRFFDSVLFDLGSAELKDEAKVILDKVGTVLKGLPNYIRAEGHTDDLPISTYRYPSNWELSTARAGAVIRYLVESCSLPPERLSAVGYGEYRPIAPNHPGGQPLNRRVDLVILRSRWDIGEPAGWKSGKEGMQE